MPRCCCSQCGAAHNVATKSLGKKGRCSQCQAVFVLHAEPFTPAPRPVQTPPTEDVFIELRPPEPSREIDLSEPLEEPTVREETDWMDALPGAFGQGEKQPGVVASLESRPVITAITSLLFGAAIVSLALAVLAFGLAIRVANGGQPGAVMAALTFFTPLGGGLLLTAVLLMGLSELLAILRGIEVRQHEISKNCAR